MYCMFCGRYHSNCPRFCTLCGEVHDFVKDEGDYGDTDDDGTSSAVPVDWSHTMGPKRNQQLSPEQSAAKRLKKKYTRKSPTKGDRVKKALYEVSQNKVSIRKAAKKYSLSYGFLHRRLSGEVAVDSRNGPETVFTSAEEEAMAKWLKEMAEKGLALMPGEFLDFVQRVVNEEKRVTPFKNSRPSYEWYRAFLARNSHIIETRRETPLEGSSAKLSKDRVDGWFSQYRDFVLKLGLVDKPKHIFNASKTRF